MANSTPVWHNIFRKIILKPDNITFEAETYKDELNILRGPGVAWQGSSDLDTVTATGNDTFMINVDYDISIPLATTDLSLEDVNGNISVVTFTAGRGVEIIRNSAQELEWRSYSVTETDTLQSITERNNITNNKIFVNDIEVGTISSSFTEDGFPSYDAGHNLVGDGTLDNPLQFSPEYQDSLMANNTDQFEFTALGPGTLAYSSSYQFDTGATTASVTLEREDPSNPGTWVVLDVISGVTLGYSYAIQGIYSELYSGNVNYRLTYTWTGNLGVVTWHVQNTFEGGAYTPITSPQFKTDTNAKTVDINDFQFFQNNIRTTVSNTDIVLDPAGTGKVVVLSDITASTFTGDLSGNVTGDITGNVISTNTSSTVVDTSAATTIFTGNLTGNADTVTDGVYTTGSYADPSWITSLDGSKLTGTVVATNGVVTSSSYADPSWITSLDASKIVGSIQLSDITIDGDLRLFDNVITTSTSNSDIVLDPNGTGKVVINSDAVINEIYIGIGAASAYTFNTVVGKNSLSTNITGNRNTSLGYSSLSSNSAGNENTAIGYQALMSMTVSSGNIAVGYNAMNSADNCTRNGAIGLSALGLSAANDNIAIGYFSQLSTTTGTRNTSIGYQTLSSNDTGSDNIAIGHSALDSSDSSGNIAIGYQAGNLITTGTNNVIIGYDADVAANNNTNSIVIGYQATGAGSNTIVIGNASHTAATINGALTATSIQNTPIGSSTRAAGNFTSLDANSTVGLSPANAAVTISPTGTGSVTINPAGASTMNNVTITVPAGTTTVAPFRMTSGTDLSSATAGAMEYDGTVVKFTGNTNIGRSPIRQMVFTSGTSASSGATVVASTNYALFPTANDNITLPVGTYIIECMFRVDTTAAVSNALSFTILGAGNATCTFIAQATATNTTSLPATSTQTRIASSAANAITAAVATATQRVVYITGVLRVTVQGTIIPSIQFTGAAGTMTFYADNYMIINPLSNSGSTASTGGWG